VNDQSLNDIPGRAFISYVREDRERVDRLQGILETVGIRVWRDTADLWPGQDWKIEIRRAITTDSLAFIACFSEESQRRTKSYQNEELILACEQMRLRRPGRTWLIPVRFADCEIPDLDLGAGRTLNSLQRIDLFEGGWERGVARLVAAVYGILGSAFPLSAPISFRGSGQARSTSRPEIWGREIPHRNKLFTGRSRELRELNERFTASTTSPFGQQVIPLSGLSGVGKTEIAAEYVYRYRDHYDVCWWVRAEQEDLVLNAMLRLGILMELENLRLDERDYSVELVFDALNQGKPYSDWLIVFDNAGSAGMIARYIPSGTGNVIITSRDTQWRKAVGVEGIEVSEFETAEAVEFLRKRVPALDVIQGETSREATEEKRRLSVATELAETLGNLPIAIDHVASYMVQTGASVDECLKAFRRDAFELFAFDVDMPYPLPVATAWSATLVTLSPEANAFFMLLAFFNPEPIYRDIFMQPITVDAGDEYLQRVLDDTREFRRALSELVRFSMVKRNDEQNTIQLNPVVQAVARGRVTREDPERASNLGRVVQELIVRRESGRQSTQRP